jgi:hypothetical protein
MTEAKIDLTRLIGRVYEQTRADELVTLHDNVPVHVLLDKQGLIRLSARVYAGVTAPARRAWGIYYEGQLIWSRTIDSAILAHGPETDAIYAAAASQGETGVAACDLPGIFYFECVGASVWWWERFQDGKLPGSPAPLLSDMKHCNQ